jgi:tRNA threonylcarbamoyladenosine biosynthesis protein TsaB
MNILAIDTSTKALSVAVFKNGKVVLSKEAKLEVLSSSIIPTIDKALKSAKLPLSKIDTFAVGLGPGSFTSLRVGVSTIKGFSFVHRKPVVGIVSHDVIATAIKGLHKNICVMTDAKRNMVYACLYSIKGDNLEKKSNYLLSPIEDVLKLVKEETLFVGDAIKLYRPQIEQHKIKTRFADEKHWMPQAKHMLTPVLQRLQANKIDDPIKLVPLYLYPEDCQVDRKK